MCLLKWGSRMIVSFFFRRSDLILVYLSAQLRYEVIKEGDKGRRREREKVEKT